MPAEGFKLGLNFGAVRGHAVQINKKFYFKGDKNYEEDKQRFHTR